MIDQRYRRSTLAAWEVVIKELVPDIQRWRAEGGKIALARVIRTGGSSPRGPGAAMIVNADGRVSGSVSGGCVEGAVVMEALEVLATGEGRLVRFGYSDDDAFAVGLTCGGVIDIYIAPALPELQLGLERALSADDPVVLATVIGVGEPLPEPEVGAGVADRLTYLPDQPDELLDAQGSVPLGANLLIRADGTTSGSLGRAALEATVVHDALGALQGGSSSLRSYGERGEARRDEVQVFFDVFCPPPRMVIFGAVDFTAALTRVAKVIGYHVTVCDARATFATRERFPVADEVVVDWPHRYLDGLTEALSPRDAICVLTHDPKFDVPAIVSALATDVGYLGAMGSRRTHAARLERLVEAGVSEAELARLMAPIGLDIGARTPEETAISIIAEIIARRGGGDGRPLRSTSGPIHHATSAYATSV